MYSCAKKARLIISYMPYPKLAAQNLGPDADPNLLIRCAKFFIEHENYERAVQLLSHAKKYREVKQICKNLSQIYLFDV
jgi:hypothetical protein